MKEPGNCDRAQPKSMSCVL